MRLGGLHVFLITLIIASMIAIWHMDVALAALINKSVVSNGWTVFTPYQTYHIALYSQLICIFMIATLASYGISRHDVRHPD